MAGFGNITVSIIRSIIIIITSAEIDETLEKKCSSAHLIHFWILLQVLVRTAPTINLRGPFHQPHWDRKKKTDLQKNKPKIREDSCSLW